MGIVLGSQFDVKTALPLDSRLVVADLTARNALAALVRYEGMIVYVLSEQNNYQLIGGITNSDWIELSSNSGGGGGGAIEWQSLSNGAFANQEGPLGLEYVFSIGRKQELVAYIKIPQSYKAGKPIVLFGSFYTDANTNNYRFQLTATLLKDGVTAIASTTNQNVDTIQLACPATSTAPLGLIFNITTNGEINSIAIGVDDIIILKLQRTDTVSVTETTSDINFLPQTTEVTYV